MVKKAIICKITKKEAYLKSCISCDDVDKVRCRVWENLLNDYKWSKIKKFTRKKEVE